MTRVLLVHPGHSYSTADVYTGVKAGLEANGVEVIEYRLDTILALMNTAFLAAEACGVLAEGSVGSRPGQINPSVFASSEVVAMALHRQPDAVLVVNGSHFEMHRAWLMQKLHKPGSTEETIPVACIGTEAPYQVEQEVLLARAYTHWFTTERCAVETITPNCANTQYLPHAFNPAVHFPGPADPDKERDVVFIGTGFLERQELFGGVDWEDINVELLGAAWNAQDDGNETPIDNAETAAWYRSAKIVLNHHRTSTYHGTGEHIPLGAAESLGPRAYEIAACKAFQLVDDSRPELHAVFGDSIATYRAGDSADLERQIRYWLDHPAERLARAEAQCQAVQAHTWHVRARQVVEALGLA